jgi:F-type H+-transporting ATPase subunit gamma
MSTKKLKSRLESIKSTKKVTEAMRVISASKLHRSRKQLTNIKQYLSSVASTFRIVSHKIKQLKIANCGEKIDINKSVDNSVGVVIGSDKGLCGGFNIQLFKIVQNHKKLFVFGDKISGLLKKHDVTMIKSHAELRLAVLQLVENESIDECIVYFNKFDNMLCQRPIKEHLFFIDKSNDSTLSHEIECNVNDLLQFFLEARIQYFVAESMLSEHAMRLKAMDGASKNASNLIDEITLIINRLRQSKITQELSEIVTGVESMRDSSN